MRKRGEGPRSARRRDVLLAQDYVGDPTRLDWVGGELATLAALGYFEGDVTVLDLGSGHCTEAIFLASIGCKVTAVDKASEACAAGRVRRAQAGLTDAELEIVEADVLDAKVDKGRQYDFVVDRLCMNNLSPSKQRRLVGRVARALKPGGRWIVRAFTPDWAALKQPGLRTVASTFEGEGGRLVRSLHPLFKVRPAAPFLGMATPALQPGSPLAFVPAVMAIWIAERTP